MQIVCLRIALIVIDLTFIFGIYTLGILWPGDVVLAVLMPRGLHNKWPAHRPGLNLSDFENSPISTFGASVVRFLREDGATRELAGLAQVVIDECPRNPERHGGIAQAA